MPPDNALPLTIRFFFHPLLIFIQLRFSSNLKAQMTVSANVALQLPRFLPFSSSSFSSLKTFKLSITSPKFFKTGFHNSYSAPLLFCTSSAVHFEEIHEEDVEIEEPLVVEAAKELPKYPTPKLSVKEKKELASYAHSIGKKLKIQQVGKGGITVSVAAAFVENLESNELLKIKVSGNCAGEFAEVVRQLEESTGSVAVDQIGRTVILYRPSQTKMQKNQASTLKKSKEYFKSKMQAKSQP